MVLAQVPTYSKAQKLRAFAIGLKHGSPFFEVAAEGLRIFDRTDQIKQREKYLGKVKQGEFIDVCRALASGISEQTQDVISLEIETQYHQKLVSVVGYLRNLALRMNYDFPLGGPSFDEVTRQIPSDIAVALNGGENHLVYDTGSSLILSDLQKMKSAITTALESEMITSQTANAALLRIDHPLTVVDVMGLIREVNEAERLAMQ